MLNLYPRSREVFAKLAEKGLESTRTDFNYYNESDGENYVIVTHVFENREDAVTLATAFLAEAYIRDVNFGLAEPSQNGRWEVSVSYSEDDYERALSIISRVLSAFFELDEGDTSE